ncbi:hypothetical protein ACFTSF_35465 [Kribbella sp. NPDC056951]|uniref:hypothetical protein n=1 Tax=Kribbella sp. NPDC056951 TaxID=3345978 RepID=UPI00364116BB
MRTTVITYRTTVDTADENQHLIEQVFAELETTGPAGFRYQSFRLDDGITFVHVVEAEDDVDPLPQLPAFQAFQRTISDRLAADPQRSPAHRVGSYISQRSVTAGR